MTALVVVLCAIGLGVLGCVLYLAWAGMSLAFGYVGESLRRARRRGAPQSAHLQAESARA